MVKEVNKLDNEEYLRLGLLINDNFERLFDLELIMNSKYDKVYGYYDGTLRGFVHVRVLYEVLEIINLVVDPLYRRRGIATLLLEYITNMNGVKKVILEVNINNSSAIKAYEKCGFKVINERKNYYGNETALVMERDV